MCYKMNEGRKSVYHFQFSRRSTGEILLEGDVSGGNKQDCTNAAWNHMRKANYGNKFYDIGKSQKSYEDIKLYMKRNESNYKKRTVKDIMSQYGYNMKKLSDRFGIPYRTIQNWSGEVRECPEYIIKMMDEILSNEKKPAN